MNLMEFSKHNTGYLIVPDRLDESVLEDIVLFRKEFVVYVCIMDISAEN